MAAVCELVSALDADLVRLGYKPSMMKWYRGYWRRLERYFAARGVGAALFLLSERVHRFQGAGSVYKALPSSLRQPGGMRLWLGEGCGWWRERAGSSERRP
jgi:hypothetical protein